MERSMMHFIGGTVVFTKKREKSGMDSENIKVKCKFLYISSDSTNEILVI